MSSAYKYVNNQIVKCLKASSHISEYSLTSTCEYLRMGILLNSFPFDGVRCPSSWLSFVCVYELLCSWQFVLFVGKFSTCLKNCDEWKFRLSFVKMCFNALNYREAFALRSSTSARDRKLWGLDQVICISSDRGRSPGEPLRRFPYFYEIRRIFAHCYEFSWRMKTTCNDKLTFRERTIYACIRIITECYYDTRIYANHNATLLLE